MMLAGDTKYNGYVIKRHQAERPRSRITWRIYNKAGEFMDGGNKLLKDAKRRIDFLKEHGVWQ